jgi:hypothetical protein
MMPPNLVFALFALLAAGGAYWIVAGWRGRLAGLAAAAATLVFFAALFAGMTALLRSGGAL